MSTLDVPVVADSRRGAAAAGDDVLHHYLRDLVYGALDGVITTFAVVAGVAGASLPTRVVLILGVANLVADGVSMGASNYLGIRSERAARDAAGDRPPADSESAAIRHGLATLVAFIIVGAIPLLAYLTPMSAALRFEVATGLTLTALFVVGALRSRVTHRGWVRSGAEMLAVGAVAAALAYGIGRLIALVTAGYPPSL